ncbi:hypothetical protein KKB68_00975 [Patescibacteria group bacterium]|nr:hypothetical protein [Patescibacteria group bacterium]
MPKPKLPDKNFKWTPELAYVVGLIATDGNLSRDGRHITMRSSDVQLLKTFRGCLDLPSKMKIVQSKNDGWAKKPCYRIQFSNVQFYRWLLRIGLFPAKTYTIGELKIPNKYFQDFSRGHIDGDGSITTVIDRWNTFKNPKYVYARLFVRFRSVSKKHIDWIRRRIHRNLSIRGHTWERKSLMPYQTASMWTLKFAKKDSLKFLSWIYYKSDLPCLKRKRKIAEKFI